FASLFLQKKSSTVETAELNDCLPYEKSSNTLLSGGRTIIVKFSFFLFERLPAFFANTCKFFTVAEAKIPPHCSPRKPCFRGFYDAKTGEKLPNPASLLYYTLNSP
ncbi:MAG TPA: hypothetical protein VK907_06065, partial [Phnomibacter sp.]|nr:hypothetical protein [Phnomibacter sp.]